MNFIKYVVVAVIISLSILLPIGCDDGGYNSNVSKLEKQVATLQDKIDNLKEENARLIKERDRAEAKAKSQYIALSIIAYFALIIGIGLVVGFIFLTKNKRLPNSTQDTTHCPRCGWKKTPGDKKCRNCKVNF